MEVGDGLSSHFGDGSKGKLLYWNCITHFKFACTRDMGCFLLIRVSYLRERLASVATSVSYQFGPHGGVR